LFLVIPCKDNKKIVTRPLFVGKVEKKRKKADGYSLSSLFLLPSHIGPRLAKETDNCFSVKIVNFALSKCVFLNFVHYFSAILLYLQQKYNDYGYFAY